MLFCATQARLSTALQSPSFGVLFCFVVVVVVKFFAHDNSSPSSLTPDAICQERHVMERDEARLLPRPRGLSGLLKVRPATSCHNSFIPGFVAKHFHKRQIQVVC